jgi:hypothetical protein
MYPAIRGAANWFISIRRSNPQRWCLSMARRGTWQRTPKLAREHGYGAVVVNDGDILEIRADGADIIDGIEAGFMSRTAIC